MTQSRYPVLKEDIYFGKIKPSSGRRAKIRNITTEKDYLLNPASVALLELCTGTHNIDEIVAQLSTQFGEPLEKGDAFIRLDIEVIDKANHSEKISLKKKKSMR